jgi:hypothetical protein
VTLRTPGSELAPMVSFTFNATQNSDMIEAEIAAGGFAVFPGAPLSQIPTVADVQLDPNSRLYAFDNNLVSTIGMNFTRPCFDGVARTPAAIASPVNNGVPDLTSVISLRGISGCFSLDRPETLSSCDPASGRYDCAQRVVPGSLQGVYLGCEERPTPARFRDTRDCNCFMRTPAPYSCFQTISGQLNTSFESYHAVTGIGAQVGTNRTFSNPEVQPAHYAQIPYGFNSSGPVDTREIKHMVGSTVNGWNRPFRSLRNYDIGECGMTRTWEDLSYMIRDDANIAFVSALFNNQIPARISPSHPTSECIFQYPKWAVTRVEIGPQLNSSADPPESRTANDRVQLSFQYEYQDSYFPVNRLHAANVYANISLGVAAAVPGTRLTRVDLPPSTTPNPFIEGDWQTNDPSTEYPLGWQMSWLLRGVPIANSYSGSCAPRGAAHPTAMSLITNAFDRSMVFFWRLPYPRSNTPNTLGCNQGAGPRYAFCNTAQSGGMPATFGSNRPTQGDCLARLNILLGSGHPLADALRAAGATPLSLIPNAFEGGCYSLQMLPSWVQQDPQVVPLLGDATNGICGFRFHPRRVNVTPEGLQFVLFESLAEVNSFGEDANIFGWLSQLLPTVYNQNLGLTCGHRPYRAPSATVEGMLAHRSDGSPVTGPMWGFPPGNDVAPTHAVRCGNSCSRYPSDCSHPECVDVGSSFPRPQEPFCEFVR